MTAVPLVGNSGQIVIVFALDVVAAMGLLRKIACTNSALKTSISPILISRQSMFTIKELEDGRPGTRR